MNKFLKYALIGVGAFVIYKIAKGTKKTKTSIESRVDDFSTNACGSECNCKNCN